MPLEENSLTPEDDQNDKKVFIGVGHGGSDSGATFAGLVEKDINLIMALACKAELERHGVTVKLSRSKDENDTVAQEVKECNAFKPDIAIDCHNNAGAGDGFEIFYWPGSEDGLKLAQLIEKEVKSMGQNSRGVKSGKNLYFIKNTKCPSVLAEGFFLDNMTDRLLADTIDEQRAFGIAYAKGILKFFNIAYKEKNESKTYRVQVGAFKNKERADKLAKELRNKGYEAYVT